MEEVTSGRQSPHNVREWPDNASLGGLGSRLSPHDMKLPLIKCEWFDPSMVGNFVDKRNLSDIAHNLFDHMIEVKGSRNTLRQFELQAAGHLFDQ